MEPPEANEEPSAFDKFRFATPVMTGLLTVALPEKPEKAIESVMSVV
jgi:hypothetical protein